MPFVGERSTQPYNGMRCADAWHVVSVCERGSMRCADAWVMGGCMYAVHHITRRYSDITYLAAERVAAHDARAAALVRSSK